MKEIVEFLAKSPAFHVATVDENNCPRVRPFSFVMEWEGKITFATNTTKKIYKQLVANPNVEISSYNPESGEWMRIGGKVKFFSSAEAAKKMFEVMPPLKQMYRSEDNPVIVFFQIEGGQADIYSFASNGEIARTIKL